MKFVLKDMEEISSLEVYKNLKLKYGYVDIFVIDDEIFIISRFKIHNNGYKYILKTLVYIYNIETDKKEKHVLNIDFYTFCNIGSKIYFYDDDKSRIKSIEIENIKNKSYVFDNNIMEIIDNSEKIMGKHNFDILNIKGEPYLLKLSYDVNTLYIRVVNIVNSETYFEHKNNRDYYYLITLTNKIILLSCDKSYIEIDMINKVVQEILFTNDMRDLKTYIRHTGDSALLRVKKNSHIYSYNFSTRQYDKINAKLQDIDTIAFFIKHKSKFYYYCADNILYTDIKHHISHRTNEEDDKCVIFYSKESDSTTKISLSILKERTSYFSDLFSKFDNDDDICSVKMNIIGVEEYKKYIMTGEYTKNNILEIFKICNFLSDIDTYYLAFKLQDFCNDDLKFSMNVLSILSTTEYTYQLKKLFYFMINNYDKHTVCDLILESSYQREIFKLLYYNTK